MGWSKKDDGSFVYQEGSLNITLRGSAFHDTDGNGVPDGVTFENGRPVFMGIKNLHDFHFDVPRGYLVVNGNEYKLVELDGNNENGEELQLFKENVGFPQGEDRTNPAAYEKLAEHKFAYNTDGLHFTLEGGAFHDNDNDGIPDGVKIIGPPKPNFGSDGTIFDTSVENFHFKVPSGSVMVNGQKYQLAELDGNPDNGYELVVPEVQGKLGWSKNADGGFVYKRPADNNPDVMGGLTLYGKDLVDTTGTGKPDGVEVKEIIIGQETNDGHRWTKIGIEGLHGEVFLNHPEAIHSFGVKGDANYNILIVKDHGNLTETLFTNISPKATINITNDTVVIKTDGNGDYNFTGNGSFKLNDDFIAMHGGECEVKVQVKNGKIKSIDGFTDEDVVKVSKSGNIRINGQKIALTANTDMDMYGKPARTGGSDSSGDSSGDSGTAESGDNTEVAGETQELTKTKSDFEYKTSDDETETETADFTITAKNLEGNDAVTAELVQKVFGTDKQEVDSLNGEIKLDAQPTAENLSDTRAPELWIVPPAASETPTDDKNFNFEIPAVEIFDASELFGVSNKIITPQEKTRLDTSEASNDGFKKILGLQFEEILTAKNIGADFVFNSEYEFNTPLASSSQCRKQELIDFERKLMGVDYVDEDVVVDGDLVSARTGGDHVQFAQKIIALINCRELFTSLNNRIDFLEARLNSLEQKTLITEKSTVKKIGGNRMARVLIIATNYGSWAEELQAPWDACKKAGFEVTLATPQGKKPLPFAISVDPDFVDPVQKVKTNPDWVCKRCKELLAGDEWAHPKKFTEVDMKDFDAIAMTGGPGANIDMANCWELHKLIMDAYKSDKIIAALCYTVSTLVFCRDPENDYKSIIYGKRVTAHPRAWDFYGPGMAMTYDLYGTTADNKGTDLVTPGFPWPVEDLVRDAVGPNGACIARINACREDPQVYYDHPFITGTSVESSIAYGDLLVKVLKERGF